ncbi:TIGR02646 family protein [Bacillus thuringiensis]|uniref:retron system putative HNH endonuclease n=1 Tax=Bacillus thuringiensis TaxID=1428 RepID=UPI000BECD9F6|nr:retron system putative HNH endonuclease [Bacillus thuringiensis]PEC97285.1 TIGR02646 family protein [Bacillus thuringiensis]HDR8244678.1 TIGR02646 family protein [Bacillus cereus]
MRPIDRGQVPQSSAVEVFRPKKYQEFRGFLITRLGSYCSYCERPISHNVAVEHIKPKDSNKLLEKEWSNLLLACTNCNSTKGDTKIILAAYIWPDIDNSSLAFIYSSSGRISINSNISQVNRYRALKTIKLVGLDKEPSYDPAKNGDIKDQRWRERRTTWNVAQRSFDRLRRNDTEDFREQIVDTALGRGYFSIWMSVFVNDSNMLNRFVKAFIGTAKDCYDCNYNLISRPTGRL